MRMLRLTTRFTLAALAVAVSSGCSTLSGVGGTSEYSCKAPPGVRCESLSGVYANAVKKNLPSQRQESPAPIPQSDERKPGAESPLRAQPVALLAINAGPAAESGSSLKSLRSAARILRLWFKPWEDADGDLFDQGYIYLQVDGGRWLVDHAQREARRGYGPIRPPKSAAKTPQGESAAQAINGMRRDTVDLPAPSPGVTPALVPNGMSPEAMRSEAAERLSAIPGSVAPAEAE